jgi:hypothetical protein
MADEQVKINIEAEKDEVLQDVDDDEPNKSHGRRKTDEHGRKIKGRGFQQDADREAEERYSGKSGEFEKIEDTNGTTGPQRCIICDSAYVHISFSN